MIDGCSTIAQAVFPGASCSNDSMDHANILSCFSSLIHTYCLWSGVCYTFITKRAVSAAREMGCYYMRRSDLGDDYCYLGTNTDMEGSG